MWHSFRLIDEASAFAGTGRRATVGDTHKKPMAARKLRRCPPASKATDGKVESPPMNSRFFW
jgi:hypothetical protein